MKTLELEKCEQITGGNDFTDGLCAAAYLASVVALTNWWNPAGWVAGALVVADAACFIGEYTSHT